MLNPKVVAGQGVLRYWGAEVWLVLSAFPLLLYDGTAKVLDPATGAGVRTFTMSDVNNVAFSPDGKYVLAGSYISISLS